jgi:hypothetical protein
MRLEWQRALSHTMDVTEAAVCARTHYAKRCEP